MLNREGRAAPPILSLLSALSNPLMHWGLIQSVLSATALTVGYTPSSSNGIDRRQQACRHRVVRRSSYSTQCSPMREAVDRRRLRHPSRRRLMESGLDRDRSKAVLQARRINVGDLDGTCARPFHRSYNRPSNDLREMGSKGKTIMQADAILSDYATLMIEVSKITADPKPSRSTKPSIWIGPNWWARSRGPT